MARKVRLAVAPARERVGVPIEPDGSARHPLLVRLPGAEPARCNNGCQPCVTRGVEGRPSAADRDVRGMHVVLRDREPTLRRDLLAAVRELRAREPAHLALLTNGRLLSVARYAEALRAAGIDRVIVKLFGFDAASHDDHTRAPGSFDQAVAGIARAREAELDALVTFPLKPGEPEGRRALAKELTGFDPVEMPEPEVEAHPNEYRYDVVVLREDVDHAHPHWTTSFFPMAHVNTGPVCNIRCVYCNVHGGDDQRAYDRAYIEAQIDDAYERVAIQRGGLGVPTLDFIGGEPTLHPDLPELIAYGRARGFARVFICTNGVLLRRAGYLDRLVDAGLSGVRFSFHEHRPERANELADVPGLGQSYVEVATMLLSRPELHTHFFRILLASTVDSLPDYVRWLAEHNHTGRPIDLALGMPSMRGRLFDNRTLYPDLGDLRARVDDAIALAVSLGIEPMIHHAPACLFPSDPERAACLHVATMQFDPMKDEERVTNFEGDARYLEACQRCDARANGCAGLPSAYVDADPARAERWVTPISLPERWPRAR
ncbi:MAG: radical SAM protein [Sandaracinaceae bacterium]